MSLQPIGDDFQQLHIGRMLNQLAARCGLKIGDRLVLRRSAQSVRFVHPPGYSYFVMLREKLSWSEQVPGRADADTD